MRRVLPPGITTVLIPKGNERDPIDVPAEAKEKINFVPVSNVDEVLANALDHSAKTGQRHLSSPRINRGPGSEEHSAPRQLVLRSGDDG
ncbi:MAG: S16 family serine protease [Chthoniobacterales bacterium]